MYRIVGSPKLVLLRDAAARAFSKSVFGVVFMGVPFVRFGA